MLCLISFYIVKLQLNITYLRYLGSYIMIKQFLFSFLFLSILISWSSAAKAQYDDTKTVEIIENSFSLFPRHFYVIKMFNNPQISETAFTLRLASYGEVSGCNSMYESYLETKEVNGTLKLDISDSEISLDDEPRYSNYDCELKLNGSFTDVHLDRDELIKNKIKHIALKSSSYGKFGTFDIEVTKQKIVLSISNKGTNAGKSFMETLWFFPKNAVILHAPKAKLGQDVQALIKEFGKSKGLKLMEDEYKGFELPYSANSHALFIDTKGKITDNLFAIGENINVGTITTTRTIYDANGAKEEPYELEIYATLPGKKAIDAKDKYDKYDKYLKYSTDD